jgi:hypothetical protein
MLITSTSITPTDDNDSERTTVKGMMEQFPRARYNKNSTQLPDGNLKGNSGENAALHISIFRHHMLKVDATYGNLMLSDDRGLDGER